MGHTVLMTERRLLRPEPWFAALALIGLVGFGLQFFLLFTGGADANSGEAGDAAPLGIRFVRLFSFFTIQSNLFVLAASLLLALGGPRRLVGRVVVQDAVLSIAVTGIAFSFILDPSIELRGLASVVTTIFHNVIPIAFLALWLVLGPRRLWNARTTAWTFLWPVAWIAGTFIAGALTGWYPYPFLDVPRVGFWAAAGGAAIVMLLALVLTALMLLVDRRVPSFGRPPRHRSEGAPSAAATSTGEHGVVGR